jgi:hypothetical protein
MLKFCSTSIVLAVAALGVIFASVSHPNAFVFAEFRAANCLAQVVNRPSPPPKPPEPSPAAKDTISKTVQISLNVDANLLISNFDGRRFGFDFATRKFINEIAGARAITQENSATYVLPFDNQGHLYKLTISGKSASKVSADVSMTGPGFVVGFRSVPLTADRIQALGIASNGLELSFTANQDGPTPLLFLTSQSGRAKPSYRFEVSSEVSAGKTIVVQIDFEKGLLYFKTDDEKHDVFTVKMRRTNPGGGVRNVYSASDISFSTRNSYAMDFGRWSGTGELCFYEYCAGCDQTKCTKLKNEAPAP